MRKNRWTFSLLIAILLLSSAVSTPEVFARSLKDMQKEKEQYEKKLDEYDADIKQKSVEIDKNKSTIDSILGKIDELNKEIDQTNSEISRVEMEILITTEEIEKLHSSIIDLEKKIKERDVVLRERVRAMQVKGGSVNYLDVLLGASSFSDFIDRFSAINTLMDADRSIMKQQAADQKKLEEEKELVERKLAEQEENRSQLETLKASLESKRKEMDVLITNLEKEQKKLSLEKEDLEELYEEAHEMSKEVENEIIKEQKRIAEEARRLEAERKRREAEAARNNQGSSLPNVSSGTWTRPASGRISSEYGYRIHPIDGYNKLHRGTDIANSVGTPILASSSGVVSTAQFHYSFGNYVVITHSIGGQIFTTVYAHLSSLGVSAGQYVEKGQVIGRMGSTGSSTGSHLHFEFHVGFFSWNGPSAINPRRYVPF